MAKDQAAEQTATQTVTVGTSYKDGQGQNVKIETSFDLFVGTTLDEAKDKYGEDAVFRFYSRAINQAAGNNARARMNTLLDQVGKEGSTVEPDEIPGIVANEMADYNPNEIKRRRRRKPKLVDPFEFLASFNEMTAEKQAEVVQMLRQTAQG